VTLDAGPDDAPQITDEIDITQSITGAVERLSRTRQYAILGGLIALALAVFGIGLLLSGDDDTAAPLPPKPEIPLDAWAPYWTLESSLVDAPLRVPSMREISPFWYAATGVDAITVDENADSEATAAFMDAISRTDAAIVPSIVDALPAGEMAAIIADPTTRTAHVDALVAFAEAGGYDGLDLDYEQFAFSDGRDTWATTRPNWVAFVRQLSERLDDDGRTLTVSIPPVYDAEQTADSGFWVYDHGAIAPYVDRIRVMAYDFSVGEPGPIAPLAFVERSIDGVVEATGDPEKVVLGLAAYGRNWPVSVEGECPEGEEIPGVTTVNNRTVDELVERRGATPEFDSVTGEWSFGYELEITDGTATCVQTRRVHYVDADGVRLRMDMAREARLDGVALWAFGFDDPDVWAAILPTVDG
jgi:spore germination protein YaaH